MVRLPFQRAPEGERARTSALRVVAARLDGSPSDPSVLEYSRQVAVRLGAHTHGRLRQSLFGEVTSWLLRNADLPVLMAH